jgi:hypothetical protein
MVLEIHHLYGEQSIVQITTTQMTYSTHVKLDKIRFAQLSFVQLIPITFISL